MNYFEISLDDCSSYYLATVVDLSYPFSAYTIRAHLGLLLLISASNKSVFIIKILNFYIKKSKYFLEKHLRVLL